MELYDSAKVIIAQFIISRILRPRGVRLPLALAGQSLLPSVRRDDVGTPEHKVFEAQYPARTFPCQRFDDDLTIVAA